MIRRLIHVLSVCWSLGALVFLMFWSAWLRGVKMTELSQLIFLIDNAGIGIVAALLAIATRPAPPDPVSGRGLKRAGDDAPGVLGLAGLPRRSEMYRPQEEAQKPHPGHQNP